MRGRIGSSTRMVTAKAAGVVKRGRISKKARRIRLMKREAGRIHDAIPAFDPAPRLVKTKPPDVAL